MPTIMILLNRWGNSSALKKVADYTALLDSGMVGKARWRFARSHLTRSLHLRCSLARRKPARCKTRRGYKRGIIAVERGSWKSPLKGGNEVAGKISPFPSGGHPCHAADI